MVDENRIFETFKNHFNAEEFFDAHEIMESLWAAEGYEKESPYRGLTQLAVALAHLKNGNESGALSVFEKARALLAVEWPAPFNVALLVEATGECIRASRGRKWPKIA